jgi:hypothetical protein
MKTILSISVSMILAASAAAGDFQSVASCANERLVLGDLVVEADTLGLELLVLKKDPKTGKVRATGNGQAMEVTVPLAWAGDMAWFEMPTHDGRVIRTIFWDGKGVEIVFPVDPDGGILMLLHCDVKGLAALKP